MDLEKEKTRIHGFVEKGNFHAAINLAISAMNESRRASDQAGVDQFLAVIKEIVRVMEQQFAGKS